MRKFLYLLGLLMFPSAAFAQGFHVQDVVLLNQGGYAKPAPGLITVCTSTATINPSTKLCSPTVTIYSDITLMTTKTNGFKADANGNFDFYVPPGTYLYTITGVNAAAQSHIITAPCTFDSTISSCVPGGSSAAPGTPSTSVQFNGTGNFTGDSNFTWDNTNKILYSKNAVFSGGLPQFDVQCKNNLTTDTSSVQAAITAAEVYVQVAGAVSGTTVMLNGRCYLDGTLLTITGARHDSPLVIASKAQIDFANGGFHMTPSATGDGFVRFIGMGGGDSVNAFSSGGTGGTLIQHRSGGNFALFDMEGVHDIEITGWTMKGTGTISAVHGHTYTGAPNGTCPSPPCGAIGISVHDNSIASTDGAAIPLLVDSGAGDIAGFGWAVHNNVLSTTATGTSARVLKFVNLSNSIVDGDGGKSWWINGTGEVDSSGGTFTDNLIFRNIYTEAQVGSFLHISTGVTTVVADNIQPADATGTLYLFSADVGNVARCSLSNVNIVPFAAAFDAIYDPGKECKIGIGSRLGRIPTNTVPISDTSFTYTYNYIGLALQFTSGSAVAVTLPDVKPGFWGVVSKTGNSDATITRSGSYTINGGTSYVVHRGENCLLQADDESANFVITCNSGLLAAGSGISLTKSDTGVTVATTYNNPGTTTGDTFYCSNTSTPCTVSRNPATVAALMDGATITWAIGGVPRQIADVTLGGNRTLNITGPLTTGGYFLKVSQDSMGNRSLTPGTGCTWIISGSSGMGTFPLSTSANAVDSIQFVYDGTNCLATVNTNYATP